MINRRCLYAAFWSVVLSAFLVAVSSWTNGALAGGHVSFKEDIFPIIEIRCLECHQKGGMGYEKSGLDLRTYEGLMKGTRYGPVVVPRSAMTSNLITVIDGRTAPELWMPHKRKRMSKCERLTFRAWVNQGAKDN
jgi:hypothetical protein